VAPGLPLGPWAWDTQTLQGESALDAPRPHPPRPPPPPPPPGLLPCAAPPTLELLRAGGSAAERYVCLLRRLEACLRRLHNLDNVFYCENGGLGVGERGGSGFSGRSRLERGRIRGPPTSLRALESGSLPSGLPHLPPPPHTPGGSQYLLHGEVMLMVRAPPRPP
jgi:hypothetical protein